MSAFSLLSVRYRDNDQTARGRDLKYKQSGSSRPISDGGRLGPPCAKRPPDAGAEWLENERPTCQFAINSRSENGETWGRLSVIISARNYIWSASWPRFR